MSQQQILLRRKQFSISPATPTYPLDAVPGAKFAWGLHKLSSVYSGSVIRARELTGATEADIGLSGDDLDEAAVDSLRGSADVRVVQLYDQTGNSNHSNFIVGAEGGLLVSGGVWQRLSGKPAIAINGSHRYDKPIITFASASGVSYYSGKITGDSMFSSEGATGDFDALAQSGSSSTIGSLGTVTARANGAAIIGTTRGALYTALGITNPFVLGILGFNYSNYSAYRLCGRTFPWQGFFQSVIVWDSNVSGSAADIEAALNSYYGHY